MNLYTDFYSFWNQSQAKFSDDSLCVKASLRRASAALTPTVIVALTGSGLASQRKKSSLVVTHVGELSVTHVTGCTKSERLYTCEFLSRILRAVSHLRFCRVSYEPYHICLVEDTPNKT